MAMQRDGFAREAEEAAETERLQAAEREREADAFGRAVERGCALLRQNPSKRPLLYETLQLIAEGPVALEAIEATLLADPRCGKGGLAPYFYAQWLADAGIAERFDTDADGNPVSRADYPDLDDDAFDDMLAGFAYAANDAGRAVLARFSPDERLADLLAAEPERAQVYQDVLTFLQSRHHLGQIESYVRGLPSYQALVDGRERPVTPSVLIDKLSDAGVIEFEGGWRVREGKGEAAQA